MLDAEAALARALERAGLAPAGSGAAVTAALTGNPVPGLARALARRVGGSAARVVHRGRPARTSWTRPRSCSPAGRSTRRRPTGNAPHESELAMHVRAALRNGLTPEQIQEVLL